MRKLLCTFMAGFILLSFTACGTGKKAERMLSDESGKADGDVTSETTLEETETEPSETTKKPYVQAPKNESFDDFAIVTEKVLAAVGDGYDNLQYQSEEFASKNKLAGIVNMAHIWRGDAKIKTEDGPYRYLRVEILVLEYNTNTDTYKNLKVGDSLEYYADYNSFPAVVTAINGRYVISFYASEGNDMLLADKVETSPEFTLGNLQKGYDAFMKIDPDKTVNVTDSDPEAEYRALKQFEILVGKVHASLGEDDYMNVVYQDNTNKKLNKNIGIRNMVHIWRSETDTEADDTIVTRNFNVNVWILEFDTESTEYKDLKVGGNAFYYERECINSSIVTAINGKYVICIEAVDEDVKNKKTKTETAPVFTLGNAQSGYETFKNFKYE